LPHVIFLLFNISKSFGRLPWDVDKPPNDRTGVIDSEVSDTFRKLKAKTKSNASKIIEKACAIEHSPRHEKSQRRVEAHDLTGDRGTGSITDLQRVMDVANRMFSQLRSIITEITCSDQVNSGAKLVADTSKPFLRGPPNCQFHR
jgi:predicted metalloendopeptidase